MKTKLVIGYSTNQPKAFQTKFNQELLSTVGLPEDRVSIIAYENQRELSLTEAYNDLWDCASVFKDAIFVFIHHDVYFKSNGWGKTVLDLFNNHPIDILGLAGTETLHEHGVWWLDGNKNLNYKEAWGKVWHTDPELGEKMTDYSSNKGCQILQPVAAIDGVFIAFNPDTCSEFDEDFDEFHFYDISFCIKNFLEGRKIAITETIQLCHESSGHPPVIWEENRLKFCEKYANHLPISVRN